MEQRRLVKFIQPTNTDDILYSLPMTQQGCWQPKSRKHREERKYVLMPDKVEVYLHFDEHRESCDEYFTKTLHSNSEETLK